jgi:NAD+ synthase (glutamine-hydrolysing)
MKNRMIKVGTAVPHIKVGDTEYNTNQIIKIMKEHFDCGILVFPELSITGYTCGDLFGQDILLRGALEGLSRIAETTKNLQGMCVAVGLPVRVNHKLFNCAAFISEGVISALVPKINIPTYSEFYEGRWFTSGKDYSGEVTVGSQTVPFGSYTLLEDTVSGAVIGTDICEDLWVPDKPSSHACMAGANVIVNLSASDELIGKASYRRGMIEQQSGSCYCAYLYASSGTGESSTDLVFSGHSVIAQSGRILKEQIFPDENSVCTEIIDLDEIEHDRTHQTTFGSEPDGFMRCEVSIGVLGGSIDVNSADLKNVLQKEDYHSERNPFVPTDTNERGIRCRQILEIQAHGLATRVQTTGIKNLIIGISGGLDSTLALIVCRRAQLIEPSIHIIAYTMPNQGNTTTLTYTNAVALMKALHTEIREVPIGKGVNDHLNAIGHGIEYNGNGDTTYENAQARMRTYILMDAANMENGLVVGTGDLSELALGWCTYNGDHMSMYGVNASVPKTLVQYIVSSYAETCGDENLKNILISIVNTPITPELTPNSNDHIAQKTEERIGKYDLNDFFLFHVLRYGREPEKILALAGCAYPELELSFIRDAEMKFYKRFFQQQFKRSCLPDGPKVGSVSLSPRGDWRMPSDASMHLWIDALKNI